MQQTVNFFGTTFGTRKLFPKKYHKREAINHITSRLLYPHKEIVPIVELNSLHCCFFMIPRRSRKLIRAQVVDYRLL